jgi:hypothetical protein
MVPALHVPQATTEENEMQDCVWQLENNGKSSTANVYFVRQFEHLTAASTAKPI